MITPQDIDNKVFKRQMWGYSIDDVENFLEEITESYKVLYKENLVAAERISMLTDAVKQYKAMEDSMQDTRTIEALCKTDSKAKEKISEDLKHLTYQYEQMKKSVEVYRAKVVSLLNAQLEIIKDYSSVQSDDDIFQEVKNLSDELRSVPEEAENEE